MFFIRRGLIHIADYASNGEPGQMHLRHPYRQTLSDSILAGPEAARQCFVDKDHWRSAGTIRLGEESAVLQRHAERLEIVTQNQTVVNDWDVRRNATFG